MKKIIKKIIYVVLISGIVFIGSKYWIANNNRADNGIHIIGNSAVVIEGEVVVINWDALPNEVDSTIALYRRLKQ